MFSNVWSENTALFERLMEIHSNSPKLYYGFKPTMQKTTFNINMQEDGIPCVLHTEAESNVTCTRNMHLLNLLAHFTSVV